MTQPMVSDFSSNQLLENCARIPTPTYHSRVGGHHHRLALHMLASSFSDSTLPQAVHGTLANLASASPMSNINTFHSQQGSPACTPPNSLVRSKGIRSVPHVRMVPEVIPYQFGILPFALDWEVNRVANFMSMDLALFSPLIPQLIDKVDDYTVVWNELQAYVAVIKDKVDTKGPETRSRRLFLPPPSSVKAWELLRTPEGRKTGRTHCKLSLECSSNGICTSIQHPLKVGQSRRAFRRFGSDRFITLSIDISQNNYKSRKQIEVYLIKPFELCGRWYKVFTVKQVKRDKKLLSAYCFAFSGPGLQEISMGCLLEWLVSPNANPKSTLCKLYSRIALSLSSTVPTVVFAPDQIKVGNDIISSSKECMTDGCGKASPRVFREVRQLLGIEQTPSAIQGRLGGAKGVWYVDPDADPYSQELWIETKPSQVKFEYSKNLSQDTALCTLVCLPLQKEW